MRAAPAPSRLIVLALCLALGACGGSTSSTARSAAATSQAAAPAPPAAASLSFEGMPLEQGPLLAPASSTGDGVVDGISCQSHEQLVYHIHAHLAVYVDGAPRTLPAGIGIPGSEVVQTNEGPVAAGGVCIYWLHTHAPDGVIHIESPSQRIYTLGEFFAEWHQPLSADQVARARGPVLALVDGRTWHGSPDAIPLTPHTDIQLDVGRPAPAFVAVSWAGTEL